MIVRRISVRLFIAIPGQQLLELAKEHVAFVVAVTVPVRFGSLVGLEKHKSLMSYVVYGVYCEKEKPAQSITLQYI